jgi:exonuclease III
MPLTFNFITLELKLYKNEISYNVNGIRAAISKGFISWLQQANPDVICLRKLKQHQSRFRYWISSWLDIHIIIGFGYKKRIQWNSYFV